MAADAQGLDVQFKKGIKLLNDKKFIHLFGKASDHLLRQGPYHAQL